VAHHVGVIATVLSENVVEHADEREIHSAAGSSLHFGGVLRLDLG
jgi:hypothetical protein